MDTPICLVHYHELGLKGRNRSSFERKLIANIRKALDKLDPDATVRRISGRALVECGSLDAAGSLAMQLRLTPGVVRVSWGLRCERSLEGINRCALELATAATPFNSFKVVARRAHTDFALDSMQLNNLVGEHLRIRLPEAAVKMRDPDLTVHIEVIEGSAYVYCRTVKGIGGLPAGTSGSLVSLLSAGIDSPVATWRMIRRGAVVHALHFSGAPQTPDSSEHLVVQICELLQPTCGLAGLAIVPFGDIQRQIALSVPEKLRVVFYRRMMFAVACAWARQVGAGALVTGESLGQVASQTLDNIAATDAVCTLPVLRPLIGTDKQEIIAEAEGLGTFAISTQAHDDCCTLFMPRSPETHAKLDQVEQIWADLPVALWLEQALSGLRLAFRA